MRSITDNALLHNIEDAFIEIGYNPSLIQANYQYADLFEYGVPIRTVEHAIFGQEPLDYRSACFGIETVKPNFSSDVVVQQLRALGAPQILIINNGTTERWAITEKKPLLQDKYKTAQLPEIIKSNIDEWNPKTIIRAKSGFTKPGLRQLDFVDIGLIPALEQEAAKKIDRLLRGLLHHTEEEFKKHQQPFDAAIIFRAVFSLLAAKLLKDRAVLNSPVIDFSDPESALAAVRSHYGKSLDVITSIPTAILYAIALEIGRSFSLKNISVDTLTYIYEHTFVSDASRRLLGIHSTPSFVADYLLSQLPLEDIPNAELHTLDPMCGHGILLIAAMRRMKDLLPSYWDGKRRHKYFVEHLHGIEIDSFSALVARLCLMLADFPESNGWDIRENNAFEGNLIEESAKSTMLMIANPPFETTKVNNGSSVPKPLLLLKRILPALPQGSLLGIILPRSFLDSNVYKNERKLLLDNYEIESITTLPDRIFLRSDSETTLVCAKKQFPLKSNRVYYREVRDAQRDDFKRRYAATWTEEVTQAYFDEDQRHNLIVPYLHDLWDQLKDNPCLEMVADFKTGIRYKEGLPKSDYVRENTFTDAVKGFYDAKQLLQYSADNPVQMSLNRENIINAAWKYPWELPKVIVPAARKARGPWRFAAAIDLEGRVLSRRFYAVWPKNNISVFTLAALLNSPLAQASVYCSVSGLDLLVRHYKGIPIPAVMDLQESDPVITSLVQSYLAANALKKVEEEREFLLKKDSEILKLYHLSPKFERQLLDIFWNQPRPVSIPFTGYIPPEMTSWIPLHIYISEAFANGSLEKVMSRLPIIQDEELIKYLKNIGTE